MSSSAKKRTLAILRPLFALLLLALVAYNVPWRDRLVFQDATHKVEIPGEIRGDWRGDEIQFQADPGASIETGWPIDIENELRSPLHTARVKRSVTVDGQPSTEGSLGWRPGMLHVFGELDPRGLWIAMGMFLVAAVTSVTRWWRLLGVAGCAATWWTSLRLTFLGFFFNLVVPGLTGGDLIKAVMVVRENPDRRADALVSVIVDRGLGLFVLVGLATLVVLIAGDHFRELRLPVVLTFAGMSAVLWIFLHPGPRRILRLEALFERLPQKERIKSVDRALRIYSHHPLEMTVAVLLSVFNHVSIATGVYALGRAFGDQLGAMEYMGLVAIANLISSLPIAPGGWGVGEAAFAYLFHLLGGSGTVGVAVSVTYRLLMMALSLLGGVFLLLPGAREVRRELAHESPAAEGSPPQA